MVLELVHLLKQWLGVSRVDLLDTMLGKDTAYVLVPMQLGVTFAVMFLMIS